jgi:hypothetical protein
MNFIPNYVTLHFLHPTLLTFNIAFLDDRQMKVVRFLALLTGHLYLDWMELAQDRDKWWAMVSAVMNLRVP